MLLGTSSNDIGYERVAVCKTGDPSWSPRDWADAESLSVDKTHLVRDGELLVPADGGDEAPEGWEKRLKGWRKTNVRVGGYVLFERNAADGAQPGPAAPPSGVPVMEEASREGPVAPNAVFCSQGLRASVEELIGPFKVAPRYQGVGGTGPHPPERTLFEEPVRRRPRPGRRITVGVVDTGIGQGRFLSRELEPFLFPRCLVSADTEDHPDFDLDGRLDAVAGHGTFTASQIARAEPQVAIQAVRAVDMQGAVSDLGLAEALDDLYELLGGAPDILNLSLGGYTYDDRPPPAVADRLRALHEEGTAIVAAAGNLNADRLFWPAAMREVIGVGAVTRGPDGGWVRTDYSNYGPWVKAAVAADPVVSWFYENFTSKPDPEDPYAKSVAFEGLAVWEGTSFMAPQVAGALCRLMIGDDALTPHRAWERLEAGGEKPSAACMPEAAIFTRQTLVP